MWTLPGPCLQTGRTWGWGGCLGLSRGLYSDSNPPSPGCCRLRGPGASAPTLGPKKQSPLLQPNASRAVCAGCAAPGTRLHPQALMVPTQPSEATGRGSFPGVAGDPLPATPPSPTTSTHDNSKLPTSCPQAVQHADTRVPAGQRETLKDPFEAEGFEREESRPAATSGSS